MKHIFLLLALAIAACFTRQEHNTNQTTDTVTTKDTIVKNPDITTERNKILSYFERHKHEDMFDMTDRTYADWWELWRSNVNSVTAGHLFNRHQVHAVLFYVVKQDTAVIDVRLKKGQVWEKIFTDTIDPGREIVLEDWNQDGTKDLSLKYMPNSMSRDVNYDLYLTDKTGTNMHPVANFWELRTPKRDTLSRIITTRNEYRNLRSLSMYSFNGAEIKEMQTVNIYWRWNDENDDTVTIRYMGKSGPGREITTREKDIDRYLPAPIKRRLAEKEEE